MKSRWISGQGILAIAITLIALAVQPAAAESDQEQDKYAQLTAALQDRYRVLMADAREAQELAEGYREVLREDPDLSYDEEAVLRKSMVQERIRAKDLRAAAGQYRGVVRSLREIPGADTLSLSLLHEAYQGLGELSAQGRAAWDQLLSTQQSSLENLREGYALDLNAAQAELDNLETTKRANELLLKAIDFRRPDATNAEFHLALKLSRLKTAIELGFGITNNPEDRDQQAQTTLLALIGYSQFFWDHYTGARSYLSEPQFPRDIRRNIFGVPDGGVLTSDAIADNQSNFYYLSDKMRENFNHKLRWIWGPDHALSVNRWNQHQARTFHHACEALSTKEDGGLIPNQLAFELLGDLEVLIDENAAASKVVEGVHAFYRQRLEEAAQFGERARLSTAHYNAEIWAKKSDDTIAGFEAAFRLLDDQLAKSSEDDWRPNLKGIQASINTLKSTRNRVQSVHQVREELIALLP